MHAVVSAKPRLLTFVSIQNPHFAQLSPGPFWMIWVICLFKAGPVWNHCIQFFSMTNNLQNLLAGARIPGSIQSVSTITRDSEFRHSLGLKHSPSMSIDSLRFLIQKFVWFSDTPCMFAVPCYSLVCKGSIPTMRMDRGSLVQLRAAKKQTGETQQIDMILINAFCNFFWALELIISLGIYWFLMFWYVLYFPKFDRPLFLFLQADRVAGETIMHGDTVYIKAWIGTTFDFDASWCFHPQTNVTLRRLWQDDMLVN